MALTIRNLTKGTTLGQQIRLANTFWARLKGLLGTDHLASGHGLLITPCNSIHMFGMKYAIDVLFLDSTMRVLKVVASIAPGQTATSAGSTHALELPAGTAEATNTTIGDQLQLM